MSAYLSRVLSRVGARLCWWAHQIEQRSLRDAPRCVDCGQPAPPEPDSCPTCEASWEQQKRDEEMYGAGARDAWREAERKYGGWP